MSNHPEIPGYYFVPRNTENLIELTFKERCILLRNQGNYTVNPDATLSDFERSDMACLLDNSRIPTHRSADAQLPVDIAYGSVPIFTLFSRSLPDFEEVKQVDPISMYLSSSKEEFINKLAENIYSVRRWIDNESVYNDDDEKSSKALIFYAMLGHIVHTQGWAKLSAKFQLELMEACDIVSPYNTIDQLSESLGTILEKFTRMK